MSRAPYYTSITVLTPLTGANSPLGIGRASAHQFAQNGAKAIYICDFNDSNLETHKRELASLYPRVDVHTRQFDAADESAVKAVVDDAIKAYGRLDIFYANAGIVGQNKLFADISADEFLGTLKTNVVR
jgi:NAD(P)-dependent dehydrogenase (short-subunit alcohol dehydrogenase family)